VEVLRDIMTDLPRMIVVEPAAEQAKHRAAGIFLRKEQKEQQKQQPDIAAVKERLQEIRRETRNNHTALLADLKTTLSRYEKIRVTTAGDAREAAGYIREIAAGINLLSLNKSNVVVNELRPELDKVGFTSYLRYFREFQHFEADTFQKQVRDYWSLPGMHDRGVVESFAPQSTGDAGNARAARNYVAILGVNAISADDGAVFFLQHMANISKDLEQAQKVILVVSREKILKDREQALFHTQCMGIFGLESILLDLVPRESEIFDFDGLPLLPDNPELELHVIILDSGRSSLPETVYQDLFLCIDCRACARQCPIGQHQAMEEGLVYSPKNYLWGFLQGWQPTLDACLHCGRCHVECPVDIDIPTLIWRAQFEHYARHARSMKKRMLDDPELLARLGSLTAPLSNSLTNLAVTKFCMQLFTGVHRDAHLPTFHRRTFRDWFQGSRNDQ
jgi:L-lactate utilization protein LutB